MASPVITKEDVLEKVMSDGTIDTIRLKIINQLKANEVLQSNTIKMVESALLKNPEAEKLTKRQLVDALRKELEAALLAEATSVRDLILDQNGLGKEIDKTVERVILQLAQPTKEKEDSSSKKRSYKNMSTGEADGVTQESGSGSAMPENVTKGEMTSKHGSG